MVRFVRQVRAYRLSFRYVINTHSVGWPSPTNNRKKREKERKRERIQRKEGKKENILALHTSLRQSVLQLVAKVYLVTIRGLPSCQRLKRPTVDNHVAGRGRGDEKNRDTWKRRVGMW